MRIGPSFFAIAVAASLAIPMTACLGGPSRVAQGQLYVPGRNPYDTYFHDVHGAQVDAASWDNDRKSAHRALVNALDLTPDAPDVTIVQATHERAAKYARGSGLRLEVSGTDAHVLGATGEGGTFFHAVEETVHGELERAKQMHGVEPRLDALGKQGRELDAHVREDFEKRGSRKVTEVDQEMRASFDAIDKLLSQARGQARESEDFVSDLQRAIETAAEDRNAGGSANGAGAPARKPPAKTTTTTTTTTTTSREKPKHDESPRPPKPPAETPAPKPTKPADTGEVFTP